MNINEIFEKSGSLFFNSWYVFTEILRGKRQWQICWLRMNIGIPLSHVALVKFVQLHDVDLIIEWIKYAKGCN
jgi:hypothetical protein